MAVTLTTAPAGQANGAVKAPAWARELLGPSPAAVRRQVGGIEVSVLQGKDRAMVSAVVGGALRLARKAFEDATTATYEAVRQELETLTACHPLRLWNFIPELLAPLGDLPHRYMAFNAGRYRSYGDWFEPGSDFASHIPTATGVGHDDEDLEVHCLSCTRPGTAVENPRQIASYCYSRKYGPLPPCFARATRIEGRGRAGAPTWLLVGGTASVVGEESVHTGDLEAQAQETFHNLAAVVAAGTGRGAPILDESPEHWQRYRHLRVYYVRSQDLPRLQDLVEGRFQRLDSVEYRRADLCRPELLVEIEGVAELETRGPVRPSPEGW